jgi:ribosomal protein S12 methylthiotransferase accessory factor
MSSAGCVTRLNTSLRSRPAIQTVTIAQRLMPKLGVTHLLDVTSLDHLGLPVFMSVRPGGGLVKVHSGKGMQVDDARAGALMEAIEHAACESASLVQPTAQMSWQHLTRQWPDGLGISDFAPRLGFAFAGQVATVGCERLQSRRRLHLPAELVLMPAPLQSSPRLFGSSSNGLASGNTLEEATLHGLLEVVERDTVALHMAKDETQALVIASLPPPFAGLARAWRKRGVRLHVRHLPNDLGLACFEAALHEPGASHASIVLARGWGIHFDRHLALSRAICEAAQSRLAWLFSMQAEWPGAAEMSARLKTLPDPGKTAQLLASMIGSRRRVRFETLPHGPPLSIREALRSLFSRMQVAGLGPVFRHRLHIDGDRASMRGLHVVKVVVARSETPVGVHPRMGPRLWARLQSA